MEIKFEKWQGLGNDFIILENATATSDLAIKLCNRNFGIGADGIFSPKKSEIADIAWDFYNSDGSVAQMCGNGIRCFAKYVLEKGLVKSNKIKVETLRGIVSPEVLPDGFVKVDMGKPILEASKIPVKVNDIFDFEVDGFKANAVSMGNPHCVIFDERDGEVLALKHGKNIENSSLFPEKTNVEFVKVLSENKIEMHVFERGCGVTLACGTGACASVVAGVHQGFLKNHVEVVLKGGVLKISYEKGSNVMMVGDAKRVFEGLILI